MAVIGSYGHVNVVLRDPARAGVRLVAAARWGDDDGLGFLGQFPSAPPNVEVFDHYEEMLDHVRPDIAAVFMPLYRNAEASTAAVRRGCHVISEKPLATDLADLDRLRKAVEGAPVRIAALFTARCEPAFQAVRKAVADGRIGEVILASGQKSYPFATRDDFYKDRRTYGGSIPWQGIHALDFISYCTGKDYTRVAAMAANDAHPSHPGMEDNGGMLLGLSGGGHAVISFDYLRPWGAARREWGDERLRVAGTKGVVEVLDAGRRVLLSTPDADEEVPLAPRRDLLAEFADSIRGERECVVTSAESFRLTEVALKARLAADTGRVVDL
jgi:predicted dehydrogenase